MHVKPTGRFAPNAFLIGAQKSGTTFLAGLLDQSPDICVASPKEPHFFSTEFERGWDFYESCFRHPYAKIRLDASTTYSFLRPKSTINVPNSPGLLAPVPERIFKNAPDARLIYILRDPISRIKSGYLHKMRGRSIPNGPISIVKCMEEDPMLELISRYSEQIERYLEFFSKDQFLFIDFRDLTKDPISIADKVCKFLGVNNERISVEVAESEKHSAYQVSKLRRRIDSFSGKFPIMANGVRYVLPDPLLQKFVKSVGRRPVRAEFCDEMTANKIFRDERSRIKEITGINL